MKINYTLTKRDLRRYRAGYYRYGYPYGKYIFWLIRLGLIAVLVFAPEITSALIEDGFWLAALAVGLPAGLIWLPAWVIKVMAFVDIDYMTDDCPLPENHGLELLDDGLTDSSETRELELKWFRLTRLAVDRGRVYLIVDEQEFIVIPAAAFENDGDRAGFVQKISTSAGLKVEDWSPGRSGAAAAARPVAA